MSIRARFLAGSLGLLVLFAAAAGVVLHSLHHTRSSLLLLSGGYLPLSQAVTGIKASPLGLAQDDEDAERLLERVWRLRRSEGWVIDRMATELAQARDGAEALLATPLPPQDSATLRSVAAQCTVLLDIVQRYREAHAAFVEAYPTDPTRAEVLLPELADLRRQIDLNLRVLSRRLARRQAQVVDSVLRELEAGRSLTVGVSTAALLVGVALLLSVGRALQPIRRLISSAERMREGRFDERVGVEGSDEIARLARAFNAMAASVEERERRLAERTRELESALQELQSREDRLVRSERLAAIGRMAAQVAHEIRNPLNALGLNAEMLADEFESGDAAESRAMITAIRREVARLVDITESYLALGRLPPLRIETMALGTLLVDLARFLKEEAARLGVEVVVDIDPQLPPVAGDQAQLWQALLNVVRNAVEALAGRDRGQVVLRARRDGAEVRLDVEDDGPGMPAAVVSRIFDPFFSTKERGSGLGLPITHQVIAEHGGRITCQSAPGSGTTFHLWLPVSQART